ncbi:NFACT RNA binding domain-containing protein [Clostridiaceae bacterium 35-E11]
MPFDGMVVSAIAHELQQKILHAKIEKIYQPESDEINILMRCFGKKYKLLLSASSNHPRIHFTEIDKTNPQSPPMFCMLMRKYLVGGKIVAIQQKDFERIIMIDIESHDELGYSTIKQLIIEIMGKHSNIILIDKSHNKILDSIKRISGDINRYREILPGRNYIFPPTHDKKNPLHIVFEEFISLINNATSATPIYKGIYTTLQGISPLCAREICYHAKVNSDTPISNLCEEDYKTIWSSLKSLLAHTLSGTFSPNIIVSKNDHQVLDFYTTIIHLYKPIYTFLFFDSISDVLEQYYLKRDVSDRLKQKSTDLRKFVTHTINKLYKKYQKLQEEWITAEQSQKYRIYGELLTANLHSIKKGDSEIEVINFYDEHGRTICIPLDIQLTPAQNAQKYFKKYTKAKNALRELQRQLQETKEEIHYFENLLHTIENAAYLEDIEEIRSELVEEGYLRKRKTTSSQKKKVQSKPLSFISSDGFNILVGKNNKQNDMLTLKIAAKKDLWFHTKDIPGSHVVIVSNNKPIPDQTILEAAEIAAFYSKAKQSSNVPVDYTEVKNVKKPSSAKPGMVIYENQKTLYITPRHDITTILDKNKSKSI